MKQYIVRLCLSAVLFFVLGGCGGAVENGTVSEEASAAVSQESPKGASCQTAEVRQTEKYANVPVEIGMLEPVFSFEIGYSSSSCGGDLSIPRITVGLESQDDPSWCTGTDCGPFPSSAWNASRLFISGSRSGQPQITTIVDPTTVETTRSSCSTGLTISYDMELILSPGETFEGSFWIETNDSEQARLGLAERSYQVGITGADIVGSETPTQVNGLPTAQGTFFVATADETNEE